LQLYENGHRASGIKHGVCDVEQALGHLSDEV